MKRIVEYWRIPEDYVRELGGVKWSIGGETLNRVHDGSTLAFGKEVVQFLEGFALQRPLIHFGCVILLLDAVLKERPAGTTEWMRLGAAFRRTKKIHRNAGAFCAVLCEGVPSVPEPPMAQEMWKEVAGRVAHTGRDDQAAAETPPFSPTEFRAIVGRALARYSDDELDHWLRHGSGPIKSAGDEVARELLATKPPTLDGVLAELAQRPRLSGAVAFMAQITGALSLPPRRLDRNELPQGGYADVTTRGRPEQILPDQFALDDLEFLRRFAENELLFYRREEPRAPAREELIVLLDQGVRTWGIVRLLLTATLFALGRAASGRKLTFRIAASSAGGVPRDPLTGDKDALAEMLEASDLSADPGLALERVLEEPAAGPRDVVLLTQPRSLLEPDVVSAAHRVCPPTRLFAVAADERGEVEFSEVKQGVPIRLSRFRVDLTPKSPPPRPVVARRQEPAGPWKGDVEPVPYPFRFGTDARRQRSKYDFDESGDWLLNASQDGMLHAVQTDGSHSEILPRGMLDGAVLAQVQSVRGVVGGFVVGGLIEDVLVSVHYDFRTRRCRVYRSMKVSVRSNFDWQYLREFHALLVRPAVGEPANSFAVVLLTEDSPSPSTEEKSRFMVDLVWKRVRQQPWSPNVYCRRQNPSGVECCNWIALDAATGVVSLGGPERTTQSITPRADGRPLLAGWKLETEAICEGHTLAFYARKPEWTNRTPRLLLFRLPEGIPVGDYRQPPQYRGFALSRDDRALLAFQDHQCRLIVRPASPGGAPRCLLAAGNHPEEIQVELGDYWLAVGTATRKFVLRWDHGRFHVWYGPVDEKSFYRIALGDSDLTFPGVRARGDNLPEFLCYDPKRFVGSAQNRLIAAVDRFGQVALFEPDGLLLCMFFVNNREGAAWLPDGTSFGSVKLLGASATPGAEQKIGRILYDATQRSRGI